MFLDLCLKGFLRQLIFLLFKKKWLYEKFDVCFHCCFINSFKEDCNPNHHHSRQMLWVVIQTVEATLCLSCVTVHTQNTGINESYRKKSSV